MTSNFQSSISWVIGITDCASTLSKPFLHFKISAVNFLDHFLFSICSLFMASYLFHSFIAFSPLWEYSLNYYSASCIISSSKSLNWLGLCVLLTLVHVRNNHSLKNGNKRNNMLYWIRIPHHCYWKYFWSVPVALSLLPACYCSFEIDLFSLAAVPWRFTSDTVVSKCRFLFYLCCLI